MKANAIKDAYQTRFEKLSKYYYSTLEDFKLNAIHHFRVEMKKLRALIRLVNLSDIEHQNKIPKPLKSFYNIAGNIRNLQLHRQRVVNLCKNLSMELPPLYLEFLKQEEESMQKEARQIAVNISLKDFEKKLVGKVPGQLTKEVRTAFVEKRRLRLEELFTLPFYYDEGLHEIRKIIKDLMYNYKHLENIISVELPPAINHLKAMQSSTQALGDFHDLCVALFLLSDAYLERAANRDEVEILNELKTQLQLRKETMKEEIIESLRPIRNYVEQEKSLVRAHEILS